MESAPAARGNIPSWARYPARIPNLVIDTGLLAALPHSPLLLTYYLIRAHDDELWYSDAAWDRPRAPRLSSRALFPLLKSRLGCSSRSARRYLRTMADLGWVHYEKGWVVLGEDEAGHRRYFMDTWLWDLAREVRGFKGTRSVRQMRRRTAGVKGILARHRETPHAARVSKRVVAAGDDGGPPYTAVDLAAERVGTAADRGALLTAILLYRYSFTLPKESAPRGTRRVRLGQEFVQSVMGASRDTVGQRIRRAEELGLLRVEPQGLRHQNVYELPERSSSPWKRGDRPTGLFAFSTPPAPRRF